MSKEITRDMTSGKPLPLILQFALPLLVGNFFQQMYNVADAAIVGRCISADALAAVGASSSVQFLVLGFCIGICCGFGVPVAQRFGGKDYASMRAYIWHSIFITIAAAVILTSVCALLCPWILHILSTPSKIYKDAYIYLLIIFLGIPCTLLYNLLSSILRAVGDSKTPFLFLVFSTILNIILDLVCIVVFHWGCAGAAIATITSQGISGLLCLLFIIRKAPLLHPAKDDRKFRPQMISHLLIMAIPMGLQYSITAIGSMVMQSANNGLGNVYVTGFTAAMRIKQFAMCPFDAIATGVSTFCGQNLGAGKIDRIKKGIVQGVLVGMAYGLVAGIVLIFFGRTLTMIFVKPSATAVLDASAKYLRCLGFFYWSLGILNTCRMTTQGLGYSGRAIFSGAVEMSARCFVSLALIPIFHFNAICFADQTAWIAATLYIIPTCLLVVRSIEKKRFAAQPSASQADATR